jgi:hypothetical protein
MSDKVDTVPGENLQYADQVTFGAVTARNEVVITPKYGGSFKAGELIRVELPAQRFIDPSGIYLSFESELFAGASNSWSTGTFGEGLTAASGIPFLDESRLWTNSANCMKTVRFKPGIQCIFDRIKVLINSTVVEDIQDYPDLYRFMLESTTSPEWRKADGAEQEGFYDPKDVRQTIDVSNHHSVPIAAADGVYHSETTYTGQKHVYTVKPMVGLLAIGKVLPAKYMGNITFEFYLAENKECLWSSCSAAITAKVYAERNTGNATVLADGPAIAASEYWDYPNDVVATSDINHMALATMPTGTTPQADGHITTDFPNAYYQISKVEMHVPFLDVMEDFDTAMMNKIEGSGLDLHFSTFREHVRTITAATGRQTFQFTERAESVKGGFVLMRLSNDIRDIRSDTTFVSMNLEDYQWKVGSEYHPPQKVECDKGGARPLAFLKQSLGTFEEFGEANNITEADYLPRHVKGSAYTQDMHELKRCTQQPSKFAIGLNLERSPGQMSGYNTRVSAVDIELIMTLRSHASRFGTYNTTHLHNGHIGGTFPPSKYKVNICGWNDDAQAANQWGLARGEYYGAQDGGARVWLGATGQAGAGWPSDAVGGTIVPEPAEVQWWPGMQPGIMMSKNLATATVLHTAAGAGFNTANYHLSQNPTMTALANESSLYTRVEFFTHVDALLRIRAVGQIEVVS